MKKRDLVLEAFGEIALAGYTFDLTPDELQTGLKKLDGMLAMWSLQDVLIGYPLTQSTPSDLDDEAGIAEKHREAVVSNLAKRIASGFGKSLMPSTLATARESWQALLIEFTKPTGTDTQQMVRGSGNARRF